MEDVRQCDANTKDVGEPEEESPIEEEEHEGEVVEVRLLRMVIGDNSRPKTKVPIYDGSLNTK
jgi:hypothetical protein